MAVECQCKCKQSTFLSPVQFFAHGTFSEELDSQSNTFLRYHTPYGPIDCIDREVVHLMHYLIAALIIALSLGLFQLFLTSINKCMQLYSLLYAVNFTVFLTSLIFVNTSLSMVKTKFNVEDGIEITFRSGFWTLISAVLGQFLLICLGSYIACRRGITRSILPPSYSDIYINSTPSYEPVSRE